MTCAVTGLGIKPPMLSHWWMPKYFPFCLHCVMHSAQSSLLEIKRTTLWEQMQFSVPFMILLHWTPQWYCQTGNLITEERDSHYGLIHRAIIVSCVIYSWSSTKLTSQMWAMLKKQDVKPLCLKAIMFHFLSCLWYLGYTLIMERGRIFSRAIILGRWK